MIPKQHPKSVKTRDVLVKNNFNRHAYLLKLSDEIHVLNSSMEIKAKAEQSLMEYLEIDYAQFYESLNDSNPLPFNTAQQLALQHGKPLVVNSIAEDVSLSAEMITQLQAVGMQAVIFIPLVKRGQMMAMLIIGATKVRPWDMLDITIAEETAERTWAAMERAKTAFALRVSEEKHRMLFDSMDEGYCIIEMIHDASGEPIDWRFLQVNRAFELHNGLSGAQGKTIKEMAPAIEPKWMKIYDSVAQTGVPLRFEEDSIALGRIFNLYAFRMKGEKPHVAVIFTDITAQRQTEKALFESQQNYRAAMEREVSERTAELIASKGLLQSVFDTTLVQLSILEAIRDTEGNIIDLEIKLVNKELEKEKGRRDLVGKCYAESYPEIKTMGIFDLIVRTIETGIPQQMEYAYYDLPQPRHFSCMFVKFQDGVIATYQNITERKKSEEERYKHLLLLRQSEELASLGSWEYGLADQRLLWSDGMYNLFHLKAGTEVSPEIYLEHALDKSRKAAEVVVDQIKNGTSAFEETLFLQIDGQLKIIHLKAMIVYHADGRPDRVLGTDADITAATAAREKLKRLEADKQREIVSVTFSTLEEERRRISESLHNGMAQILYGVKISLNGLNAQQETKAFQERLAYAHHLLSEAITENRRISHELMPPILEEFGLGESIRDIIKKLNGSVDFKCRISGFSHRLEKYIELAIYRTVQELVLNVVKHADATTAAVDLALRKKSVLIRVVDDGKGMDQTIYKRAGIGLASIRSKIKLLNGHMEIKSGLGKGTQIEITFPLNANNC